MRRGILVLSRLLAIASAAVGAMSIALIFHSFWTPQTWVLQKDNHGPLFAFGVQGLMAAALLGLLSFGLSYLLARIARGDDENPESELPHTNGP